MLEESDILDVIATEADGTPVLCIVDGGFTEDPQERLELLREKLQSYVRYLSSARFEETYRDAAQRARAWIEVQCSVPPTPDMQAITRVAGPRSGQETRVRFVTGRPI